MMQDRTERWLVAVLLGAVALFALRGAVFAAGTLKGQSVACVQLTSQGRGSDALPLCLAAAAGYRVQARSASNPFDDYLTAGRLMAAAAADYSQLNKHKEALDTALRAHELVLWVYRSFPMDDGDKSEINELTRQLRNIEVVEGARRS
jgi:hypothetical protein